MQEWLSDVKVVWIIWTTVERVEFAVSYFRGHEEKWKNRGMLNSWCDDAQVCVLDILVISCNVESAVKAYHEKR